MADIDSEKERRLVADLLEGDESAFCELYALYKMLSPLFGRIAVS